MTAEPAPIRSEQVIAIDGAVRIVELTETDDAVVRFISDANDTVDATRRCLRVGAQALSAATVRVDVDVVERAFGSLEQRLDERLTDTVEKISAKSTELFDENAGAVPSAFAGFHEQLTATLGDHFDPESKQSAIAKIEEAVRVQLETAGETMRKIVKDEMIDELRKEIGRIADHLKIADATKDLYARSTAKGFVYENEVYEALNEVASIHGDRAEKTGLESGSEATKVGDVVITLNPRDTPGSAARIVFEAKSTQRGRRDITHELESAMKNRDALIGVAVFSSQDYAPTKLPFESFDDQAIVVYDRDGTGTLALRIAYQWARIEARRRIAADGGEVLEVERMLGLLGKAKTALLRVKTIKGQHTQARNAIDSAERQVTAMVDEVQEVLDEIDRADSGAA